MEPPTFSVLHSIYQSQPITRRTLCKETGLSLGSVNALVSRLLAHDLIFEEVHQHGTPGRPAASLSVNPDMAPVVGLDIGGESSRAILADTSGHVLASVVQPTRIVCDRTVILENIVRLVEMVCREGDAQAPNLAALGVGLRGIVDVHGGRALGWPNTPAWAEAWTDLDVTTEVSRRLGTGLVVLEDSVRAMGVAAHRRGVGQQDDNLLYVFLGKGIGSALLVDGQPYRGSTGLAGELGHISVVEDGEWCSCGNRGCLEVMASTTAVLQQVRQRLSESPMDSALRWPFEDNGLTLPALLEAARAGDKIAYQILDETGAFVGKVTAIALNMLGPGLVVLGGPLTEDGGIILGAVKRQARLHALRQISSRVQIVYDEYDEFAGAQGMVFLTLDALFASPAHVEGLLEMIQEQAGVESLAP